MITLHRVVRLKVLRCVGYWNYGHNIYLQSGTEINNELSYNLIVSARKTYHLR